MTSVSESAITSTDAHKKVFMPALGLEQAGAGEGQVEDQACLADEINGLTQD